MTNKKKTYVWKYFAISFITSLYSIFTIIITLPQSLIAAILDLAEYSSLFIMSPKSIEKSLVGKKDKYCTELKNLIRKEMCVKII